MDPPPSPSLFPHELPSPALVDISGVTSSSSIRRSKESQHPTEGEACQPSFPHDEAGRKKHPVHKAIFRPLQTQEQARPRRNLDYLGPPPPIEDMVLWWG